MWPAQITTSEFLAGHLMKNLWFRMPTTNSASGTSFEVDTPGLAPTAIS
jgi:hypothetical protein